MALDVNTIAVIKALDEAVGRSVSYTEIRFIYLHYGGERRRLAERLEAVVAQYPSCIAWDMRVGSDRRLETWVRVDKTIGPV